MSKYQTLVTILDQIRKEAPSQYKSYHPRKSEIEKLNQARSKAFIHLYLKVKFGLLDFEEREKYITDGIDDGGIDGYHIDEASKRIYLIQSKFPTSESGFQDKEIKLQEIMKMDADRIVHGEDCYENGKKYNAKVQALIKRIQGIEAIALYEYRIIILANLRNVSESQLKKLLGEFSIDVLDFERCYEELVFPVVTGTYFSATDVFVYLNLLKKKKGSWIRYLVETEFRECEITVVFVPTIEIAKIMHKYRNSILQYNPRSYLDLSKNPVNQKIAKTIREKESNEFALFNNGITMLSDDTPLTKRTGRKHKAQLKLTNPQMINGGQTAYTLSKIYEDELEARDPEKCFRDKEVLLKVITFIKNTDSGEDFSEKIRLIESISKATNQQTNVTDADRRSNDEVQIEIERKLFDEFGYFYERKRGEFWNGLEDGYVDLDRVINRELFIRIAVACNQRPAEARSNSERVLFSDEALYGTLRDLKRLREYFFGFLCYGAMNKIQKQFDKVPNNKYGIMKYGNALRYGRMAVISVASKRLNGQMDMKKLKKSATKAVATYLDKWLDFEDYVSKRKHNKDYFRAYPDLKSGKIKYEVNYDNYYKGKTLNSDLKKYFNI